MVQIHPDPPFIGGVAQLGERLLCKQEVIGSIPFTSTTGETAGFTEATGPAEHLFRRERQALREPRRKRERTKAIRGMKKILPPESPVRDAGGGLLMDRCE